MSVNTATAAAIGLTFCTLLLCLFGIGSVYHEVQSAWSELDQEMDRLKV